jgi:hypothetical protein
MKADIPEYEWDIVDKAEVRSEAVRLFGEKKADLAVRFAARQRQAEGVVVVKKAITKYGVIATVGENQESVWGIRKMDIDRIGGEYGEASY